MVKIEKAIGISDAKIQFVSLVDKAANKRQFLITKAENGQAQFSTLGKIIKADTDTHYLTGIVYEPLIEDAHGNFMTESEIRKAAYWFAKNGDKVDLQHSFSPAEGVSVVESYVAPNDMEIEGQPIVKGTWLMTVEVNNPQIWSKVQKGEVTGFSMGGVGNYSEVDTELSTSVEKRGVLKKLAGLFGCDVVEKGTAKPIEETEPIEKSGKKISGKNREALQSIYDGLGALLTELVNEEKIEKKEDSEMTRAEIQALINESIKTALEKKTPAGADEKPEAEVSKSESAVTPDEIQTMVTDAIQKALAPKEEIITAESIQKMVDTAVQKAIEPILKARGLSSNLNDEKAIEKNETQHYLAGIL